MENKSTGVNIRHSIPVNRQIKSYMESIQNNTEGNTGKKRKIGEL